MSHDGTADPPAPLSPAVLLVDDHPPNLLALKAVLDPLGLNLVLATSGKQALEHLLREDFAVILLDVQMPDMDGFETAAIIRGRERTREVPIIFVTAIHLGADQVTRGYARGAVDYLAKPLDPEVLRAKVSALVELWRRGETLRLRENDLHAKERRALVAAAHQTEAQLRLIVDGVSDHAISMLDPSGRVQTINLPAERIKGFTRAEVQGQHFSMFFTPEDRQAGLPEQELITARETGRYKGEGWRQRKDGSRFYASVSLSALRRDDGELVGFVKVTQDITERRRLSEALRRREEELRLVIDAIPGLVAYMNPDQTYRLVNRTYGRWFGLSADQIIGRPIVELLGDEAYAVILPYVERVLAGQRVAFEHRVPYRVGGPRWIRAEYIPDLDQDGRVLGYISLVIDIGEAKLAEQRIEEEARRNETLYRVGAALSANLDLETIFDRLTDEATRLCRAQFGAFFYNVDGGPGAGKYMLYTLAGVPRERFAGFEMPRDTAVFHPTFMGTAVVRSDDITQDPRYGHNPPHFGMPPGHLPVRSYLAVPVVSRSGEVHGGLFFGHAERAVFTERDERMLVAVAGQAAITIDNARLYDLARAERARAEEANRAKDLFLSSLSHELRTPLNAIIGWARLLRSGGLTDDKRVRALETVDRNARAQAALIDDILDLSRITSGKMRLNVSQVEIAQVVETALETLRPAADAKGVRVQAVLDPDAGALNGDATRLQQVLWNLLSNAVKFTPRGGRVYVRLVRTESQIEIEVADTGKGIDPAMLPRVFERFVQADPGSNREHGGLGLGLAIAKHLVELHGGTIEARSDGAGQGATLTVRLPVAPVRSTPPQWPVAGTGAGASGTKVDLDCPPELTGLRVLVVDDELDARELVQSLLESCGAQVTSAATAAEAFARFLTDRPDVIVSDIGMPGEDGYSLIRRIRALQPEQGGRTPAVAVTAYAAGKDRTRALMEGFTHHVSKPTEPQELLAVVAAAVGRHGKH
jgi:PAS domain S-box-containing protein